MIVVYILLCISIFIILNAMVIYPSFLLFIDKIIRPKNNKKRTNYEPSVSYMIVAHNEEKSIKKKLENTISLDYPGDKMQILIASDNSTDNTNQIVKKFIEDHKKWNIKLHETKEHKGKTNAQNETQKYATGEILVMTDANSMVDKKAIKELVSSFSDKKIVYVCGKLVYSNHKNNFTANSESTYWNLDLKMRDVESRMQTITAGNGAIYACRNKDYIEVSPIECHDSAMPLYYALRQKRAIFNPKAIAVEKAGESNEDEFKRKVRSNRILIKFLLNSFRTLNVFKYGWFTIFYFGHRTCRYMLWLAHLIILISTVNAVIVSSDKIFWSACVIAQVICFIITLCVKNNMFSNTPLRLIGYYGMTVLAQFIAVIKEITGRSKPVWDKAESTR